jgi:hypothetical protein
MCLSDKRPKEMAAQLRQLKHPCNHRLRLTALKLVSLVMFTKALVRILSKATILNLRLRDGSFFFRKRLDFPHKSISIHVHR